MASMLVDTYTHSDAPKDVAIYDAIKAWSPDDFPDPSMLPKLGVIVWDGETLVCFVCADMSNSVPRAMIDYLMTNPAVSARTRHRAVILAERFIVDRLREHGYSAVIGVSRHAGVASLSRAMGYAIDDKAVLVFTKTI